MPHITDSQNSEQEKLTSSLEKALIASEIRYRRLFESAKDGILILDPKTGMIVDVNPFLIELLGYSKERFIEKTIWEIGFFRDIIDNKDKFLELQQDKYVRYEDLPLETAAGRKINVEFVSNVYLVNNQKVIQCNIRDITERKVAEAGLEKNRKELAEIKRIADEESIFTENIINTVREPLLVLDDELRVIKASRSFYNFFKVIPENTIGILIYELGNHQWDIPKLRELLEKILPEKTTFDNYEVEHNFSSIGTRIMLLNARQIKRGLGKEKIILLAFEDITERKRTEKSLSEKNRLNIEYLNILLNHAHAPIIIWDSSLVIKRFNPEFEKLSGYNKSEVQDKKIEMLFPKNEIESTLKSIKDNIHEENSKVIEIDILTKDKKIKTVLWNSANISDEEGKNTVATIAQDITNRKQTEKALINSEIQYRRLFESAKDGILILDAITGMIVDVNPFLINLLGYPKDNFKQKAVWEIGFFNDIIQSKEKFLELQQEEYVRYEDLPLKTADGRTINVEFVSNVYPVDNKNVIQCNIRDITERKQTEEVLHHKTALLEAQLNSSIDGIIIVDDEGKKILQNQRAIDLWKIPPHIADNEDDHLQVQHVMDMTKNPEMFVRNITDLYEHPDINSFDDVELVDGTVLERYSAPVLDKYGKNYGRIWVFHDITERKKLETNLSTATEIAKLGYWEFNVKSGEFIFDDQYYRIIHGSSAEKQGGNIMRAEEFARRLVHPEDSEIINAKLQEAISSHDPKYFGQAETRAFRDNGDITNVMVRFKVQKDQFGHAHAVYGISQDITERKYDEQELIKAKEKAEESDRLKSAFLANMSHEIRTPMNGILGFTELLKEPNLSGEEQQAFIDIIEKSGDRMLNIINDIVNLSRVESGNVEISISETNINMLVEDIYNFFKPETDSKRIKLSFKNALFSSDAIINTDKEKVFAVLLNLVKNAVKFTQSGAIELGYEMKDKFLEFFVKDTGSGIPSEQKEIIFERFRQGSESLTRNYEGAGLGLSISKAYVDMLGGKIWTESNKKQGSTFRFTIPYINGDEIDEQPIAIAGKEILQPRKLKILVVEDDETSRMFLTIMVKPLAGNLFQAITGHEAVETCRKNPDIDLVLMDIQMPDMDGYEGTRQIRQFNKKVVIIAQTAYALPDDREKGN